MSKRNTLLVGVVCALALALAVIVYALFHGYFDHGQFEVKETSWSSSARVAIVAERSDHQAMSGNQYFVLIGDHVFSPSELRAANHSDRVIFSSASPCVSVRWRDPRNLIVLCRDGQIDKSDINVQRRRAGDVAVTYANIADANPEAQ